MITLKTVCEEYIFRGDSTVFSKLMSEAMVQEGLVEAPAEPTPAPAPAEPPAAEE